MTHTEIVAKCLVAVFQDATIEESTGIPFYDHDPLDVDQPLTGKIPANVTWTADRGNWLWDGVLIALRVMGIDTSAPLP